MTMMFGKGGMDLQKEEEELRARTRVQGEGYAPDDLDRKRAVLAVAVTGVTIVIVAAWLLTLPMQLDNFQILDDDSVARWYVIQEDMENEGASIQQQLDQIRDQLEEAAGELDIASGTGIGGDEMVPQDIAERMRTKLMELDSINQSEKDATTQEDQQ